MLEHTIFSSVTPAPPNQTTSCVLSAPPSPPAEKDAQMMLQFFRTLYHFFPGFEKALKSLPDPRQQSKIDYPLPALLKAAMILYLFKLKSRRYYNDLREEPIFAQNLSGWLKTKSVPHGDTIADALEKMEPPPLENLRKEGMKSLLKSRSLERFRLLGRDYMVAFDGTGIYSFHSRHCEHCLTKKCKTKEGKEYTLYYHSVLEAKLVTTCGMAFSIGTEFIVNDNPNASKQDCELKAFYRLLPRLRQDFPRLPMVLLLDSLFAGEPTFDLCKKKRCHFIIVFKEGTIPSIEREYQALLPLQLEHRFRRSFPKDGRVVNEAIQWVNQIEYEGHFLQVLEQIESKNKEAKKFKWLTDLQISESNCSVVANEGGRCRWKIENQGFNIQKHGGFELEHSYSLHQTGWKLFYLLLQITHNWEQCVLFSESFARIKPPQARTRRGLFERLRNIFLFCPLDWNVMWELIPKCCQLRWDTS